MVRCLLFHILTGMFKIFNCIAFNFAHVNCFAGKLSYFFHFENFNFLYMGFTIVLQNSSNLKSSLQKGIIFIFIDLLL